MLCCSAMYSDASPTSHPSALRLCGIRMYQARGQCQSRATSRLCLLKNAADGDVVVDAGSIRSVAYHWESCRCRRHPRIWEMMDLGIDNEVVSRSAW